MALPQLEWVILMNISRRSALGASLALPALVFGTSSNAYAGFGGGGSGGSTPPARIPNGFSAFATLNDAAATPTSVAKSIQALAVRGDDLFYGYGDYGANSGSMTGKGTNLSCLNLRTKTQRVVIPEVRTEAFLSLRFDGSRILAPVIDQTDGDQVLAITDGRHSQILTGPSMEHTFDVCACGPFYIVVGSGSYHGAPGSIAYEYNRVRRQWNTTPIFSNLTSGDQASDNWTRFYWTRSIGPFVFAQDGWGSNGFMTRYNVHTKKVDRLPNAQVIPSSEMAVVSYRNHIVMCDGNTVAAIDYTGRQVAHFSFPSSVFCFGLTEYCGALYMTTTEGVYRSTNISHWTKVLNSDIEFSSNGGQGWSSMAIHRGHVYLGGDNARIIRSNLPL